MPSLFVRHRVADYDAWKKAFDEHQAARAAAGVSSHRLHRDGDDPNVIVIAMRVDDVGRAKEFASWDDLRATMERAGAGAAGDVVCGGRGGEELLSASCRHAS